MTDKTTKKRGRPVGYRAANPANKVLPTIRVTEEQLAAYKAIAELRGKTFSAWVKDLLNDEVKRAKK